MASCLRSRPVCFQCVLILWFISWANGLIVFDCYNFISYCKVNDSSKNCNRQNIFLKIKLISTWRIPMSISQISVIGIQKKASSQWKKCSPSQRKTITIVTIYIAQAFSCTAKGFGCTTKAYSYSFMRGQNVYRVV